MVEDVDRRIEDRIRLGLETSFPQISEVRRR